MSLVSREDAAHNLPSLAVIHGLTYTDPAQIFNRWLVPTYQMAFRWTGSRIDSEEATAEVFSNLLVSLALPAEVRMVNGQINEAALRAVTRHWSDRYGVRRVQCSAIYRAEAVLEQPPSTLDALFDGLSAEMRLILVLRFLRKRSLAAIGAQLRMRQDAAGSTMISALTYVTEGIGLPPEPAGIAQEECVTAFVDELIAGARPRRFDVDPRAWPALVGATHVQAAIAGNDLPERRFVGMIERRLRTAAERTRVTSLRNWSA